MPFDKQKWSKQYYLKNRIRILKRNKRWNKSHPEIMAKISREWIKKNPEKARQLCSNYYKKNPKRRKLQWKKYRQKNVEKRRIYIRDYFKKNPSAQHRYKVKNSIGSFSPAEWKELKKKFNYRCAICGKKKKLTVDHIIPLSKKGSNFISNIQPLCINCNCSKQHH
jgi:5-methylcytosine-specific restriction endonuclease McrA